MAYSAGIDVGSTQTKAVLLDTARSIVARTLIPTGANVRLAGQRALEAIMAESGATRDEIRYVVGTGYGRYKIEAGDAQVTEISCHARGAQMIFPGTRTVIDMGGQDTKAIKVGPEGNVLDFCMNDKCAAGTGRFLAAAADVIGLPLEQIGDVSLRGTKPIRLTSVCTVFVESDIMSYMAQRKRVEDILAGVHQAIAARTVGLVRRVGVEREVTFTGGVARNSGMVKALEDKLEVTLNVGPESHFMGALGAALFAMDRVLAMEAAHPHEPEQAAAWSDG
jgi:predicted CoA-substrate-specific enzyme activase